VATKGFFLCLLLLESGMVGVFAAADLFLFYVFWEVMLLPMALLIGIWGGENRVYASVKFVLRANKQASSPHLKQSIPAAPSSMQKRRITIQHMKTKTKCDPLRGRVSSFWAADQTALVRELNSTTAVFMRASHYATLAMKQ
jgi:NADH:ubiquinone oxidoreductase subunit 5 (subunit L)/multisubunit Na+/H+ antiporter MnhA subunit